MNFTERVSTILDDLKKSKKIVAFCAVFVTVVSCTVLLIGAIAADSEPQMMPIIASPKQADASATDHTLLWE